MNMHVTPAANPIHTILRLLQADRLIEAIKEFRSAYGTGLKEAKDAVEAIRESCLPHNTEPTEYLVISRYDEGGDYQVSRADSKDEAMSEANRIVDLRVEVAVGSVIARSVTTRHMKEMA
jgi:hypothetical protein